MPIKVKADLKSVLKVTEDVKKRFNKEVSDGAVGYELVRTIQDMIKKGISPVDGQGRFERYSDSYRTAIKAKRVQGKTTVSPVNMYQTGEMLGSLRALQKGSKVIIEFTDKKAAYHQFAEGSMPVRKLLPQNGESFTKRITQLILKALKKAIKEK